MCQYSPVLHLHCRLHLFGNAVQEWMEVLGGHILHNTYEFGDALLCPIPPYRLPSEPTVNFSTHAHTRCVQSADTSSQSA